MPWPVKKRAVFLDRDGVLIEDRQLLLSSDDIVLAPGAARALRRLKGAGYQLVVVSNQAAVARGLLSLDQVRALEDAVEARLVQAGAAPIDAFYFCPHHPAADLPEYRHACDCRKPAPGLLLEASAALGIDLDESVMIGDRPSDVLAGRRAGCRTILVLSGRHADPPIEVAGGFVAQAPDFHCATLAEAAELILSELAAGEEGDAGSDGGSETVAEARS
jgi:D-glycero-D-manno-heptose 1,7-bisphosphate phosphatase